MLCCAGTAALQSRYPSGCTVSSHIVPFHVIQVTAKSDILICFQIDGILLPSVLPGMYAMPWEINTGHILVGFQAASNRSSAVFMVLQKPTSGVQFPFASTSSKWCMLALDLPAACSLFGSSPYQYVRSLQICATINIRGIFTSDIKFSLEVRLCRGIFTSDNKCSLEVRRIKCSLEVRRIKCSLEVRRIKCSLEVRRESSAPWR
jgi:Protein of unknown function (DUF667)